MERAYDKKYNLRLPSEVFDRVEELGSKYERSINEQMVYMLKTWQEPSALNDRFARIEEEVFPIGTSGAGGVSKAG